MLRRSLVLIALLSGPLAGASAERPQAPRLFPDTTLAYVRVGDTRELVTAFQETAMGRLGQDDEIRPLMMQLYGEASQAFSAAQEELGASLDELLEMPQGELAIGIVDVKAQRPAVAVLVEVGDNKTTALKLIERGEQEAIGNGANFASETHREVSLSILSNLGGSEQQVVHFERDGVIMIVSDLALAKEIIDRWDGAPPEGSRSLAENRKFTAMMRKSIGTENERPQISFFVDPIALVRAASRGNLGAQAGLAFLPTLGLNGLKAVGGSITMSTEQFDSIMHLHVGLDNPRRGVLKMLTLKSADNSPESWVPENAAIYSTLSMDAQEAYEEARKLVDGFRGENAMKDLMNRRIGGRLGVDVEEELLAQIAGRLSYVTLFEKPARVNSQTSLIGLKLNDPEKFSATLSKMLSTAEVPVEQQEYRGVSYFRVQVPDRRPPNVSADLFRRPTPSVGIFGDYLMFSDSEQTFKTAIDTGNGGASLSSHPDFQLIMNRIQAHSQEKPCMIRYEQPEESLRAVYGLATADQTRSFLEERSDNPFLGALHRAMKDHPLPEFSKLAEYIAPTGAMLVNDETGLHYTFFGMKNN